MAQTGVVGGSKMEASPTKLSGAEFGTFRDRPVLSPEFKKIKSNFASPREYMSPATADGAYSLNMRE